MIDAHVHCFPDFLAPRALHATGFPWGYDTDATAAGQLALMDRHGISHAIILHIANRPNEVADVNRFALRVERESDGRLIPFAAVHPMAENAIATVEALAAQGFRGVKFQPALQRFALDDERFKPLYQRIGQLGLIAVIHCGMDKLPSPNSVFPATLERCIDWFGGTTVVAAHLGGIGLSFSEAKRVAQLPVITDTALSRVNMGQFQFNACVEAFGVERVLFGSDLPWASLEREIDYVKCSGLSEADQALIFEGNARRILKL